MLDYISNICAIFDSHTRVIFVMVNSDCEYVSVWFRNENSFSHIPISLKEKYEIQAAQKNDTFVKLRPVIVEGKTKINNVR